MDNWHYSINGEKIGPVPFSELERMVAEGTLEPGDLVWSKGMADWQAAGKVSELPFPDEPPPLPPSETIRKIIHDPWGEALPAGLRWLGRHKAALCFVGVTVFGLISAGLASSRRTDDFIPISLIPAGLFAVGLVIYGLKSCGEWVAKTQRKAWLHQKWESTGGERSWIQFSPDGGCVRSDGFGAKYTFDTASDRIELRPVDDSPPILLKVVLLSEKELALTWNGKTQHYQRPSWWKRTFG